MQKSSPRGARMRVLWQLVRPGAGAEPLDLMALLGPRAFEDLFRCFVSHPDGQALLAARPDLAAALSEDEELRALSPGSLGRTCAGMIPAARTLDCDARLATAHAWFAARLRVLPGLWRVLAGYDADRGNAELLAFCGGALSQPAIAILLALAALLGPRRHWWRAQRARLAAWRCGRGAVPILVIPYESLLPCSLTIVRRSLRIERGEARASGAIALASHPMRGAR